MQSTQEIKETAEIIVVSSLGLNALVSGSISVIWGLINTLQMLLYMPLFEVVFPQNVFHLYSVILPLSSMDIIPTEYSTELIFDLSNDLDYPYNHALEQLGYETHNSLMNLGSIFFFFLVNIALLMIVFIERRIRHKPTDGNESEKCEHTHF